MLMYYLIIVTALIKLLSFYLINQTGDHCLSSALLSFSFLIYKFYFTTFTVTFTVFVPDLIVIFVFPTFFPVTTPFFVTEAIFLFADL